MPTAKVPVDAKELDVQVDRIVAAILASAVASSQKTTLGPKEVVEIYRDLRTRFLAEISL
jgi:hypothetical protein